MEATVPHLEGHTRYHFPGCAYCGRVEYAIRDLELELRRADITLDASARAELAEATGQTTVPVLRIAQNPRDRWLSESADIVRYLYAQYGDGRRPPLRVWITPAHVVLFIALVVFALSQLPG